MVDNNSNEASSDASPVERRRFLQAVAVGAAGLGSASGFAAGSDGENTIEVIETEPLSHDEAIDEFGVAIENEHAETLVDFMGGGELELQFDEISAEALVTGSTAFNERNPVSVTAPFQVADGPEYGFGIYSVTVLDDDNGERVAGSGVGIAAEQLGDEYVLQSYEMEDGDPVVTVADTLETNGTDTWYDSSLLNTTHAMVSYSEYVTIDGVLYEKFCTSYICVYDPNPKSDNHKWCCCECTLYPMPVASG